MHVHSYHGALTSTNLRPDHLLLFATETLVAKYVAETNY